MSERPKSHRRSNAWSENDGRFFRLTLMAYEKKYVSTREVIPWSRNHELACRHLARVRQEALRQVRSVHTMPAVAAMVAKLLTALKVEQFLRSGDPEAVQVAKDAS